jgi:hypothetical protein
MDKERHYLKLLETMIAVAEAGKGMPGGSDRRLLDAEALFLKLFCHASSALYLFRGTRVPELGNVSFFDPASVNVLSRAAIEAFLVFHYVFIAPTSKDVEDLRYFAWTLGGLLDQQKYTAQTSQGKAILVAKRPEIANLQQKLTANPSFAGLTNKQQRGLKRGEWRLESWSDIALSAGLSLKNAKEFYSYLCGHAHSSNLNVSQLWQASSAENQRMLSEPALNHIMIAMAFIIKSYATLFPQVDQVLAKDSKAREIVDVWTYVGCH